MALTIHPVSDEFVAEVYDIDLSSALTAEQIATIKDAFWKYAVLVFPDQSLTQEQHVRFAQHFGPMDESILKNAISDKALRVREDISDVSNLDDKSAIWAADSRLRMLQLGNRLWHTDSSFKYVPALCSMLYALEIPPVGGHTEFADLRAAYDALPHESAQRLEGLAAEHSLMYSRARMGYTQWSDEEREAVAPVPQAMLRTHPETGRKNLFVASHAGHVIGMGDEQGAALIDEMLRHASRREFAHTHRWRQHDLVIWDNRCTLHRGLPFDDLRFRRDMQRATVLDTANSCEQEGISVPGTVAA
jgi:alpha-ketoglutarate-dependent 2,4-dichlorophenoxyacetate dioxygenase